MKTYKIDNSFIFVHNPKTGGKSVWNALGVRQSKNRPTHLPLNCTEYPKDAFTFGFVRNPWDRMLSFYHYMCQRQKKPKDSYNKEEINEIGFKKWLFEYNYHFFEDRVNPTNNWGIPLKVPFQQRSQMHWLDGCKFIGRFERLQEDLNVAANLGGFKVAKLLHKNKSIHKQYTEYYDDESIVFIKKHFSHEIYLFGYRYGD